MGMSATTRAVLLGAAIAVTSALPMTVAADGHTNEFFGNKGYVGEASRPVTKQRYHGGKYRGHNRKRRHAELLTPPTCPPDFYGLFRGTLYCQAGKLLNYN